MRLKTFFFFFLYSSCNQILFLPSIGRILPNSTNSCYFRHTSKAKQTTPPDLFVSTLGWGLVSTLKQTLFAAAPWKCIPVLSCPDSHVFLATLCWRCWCSSSIINSGGSDCPDVFLLDQFFNGMSRLVLLRRNLPEQPHGQAIQNISSTLPSCLQTCLAWLHSLEELTTVTFLWRNKAAHRTLNRLCEE